MIKCRHTHTSVGQHYGFVAPVARYPHTEENRAAHGGITYTETCGDCGSTRAVNANGGHREYSPWSPSAQPATVQSALADDRAAFLSLPRSEQVAVVVEARRFAAANRHMAGNNGFWRRLSANQVMEAR